MYGRDDNREEIIDFLLSYKASGNKIGVITLVAMGGIGKNTLVQVVYKDRRVVDCFDHKAWVCVSEEFDIVRITKTILQGITSEKSSYYDCKTLGAALYSELRVKEWENVLNRKIWDWPNDDILPALRLSYSFFPSQLKLVLLIAQFSLRT